MAKEQSNNKSSDFSARRRIIKSLSATPVIYTLTNGSALALVSSHQCITTFADEEGPDCGPAGAPSQPDNLWEWDQITDTNAAGTTQTRWCAQFAVEDIDVNGVPVPNSLPIPTGYDWRFTENSNMTHKFINTAGQSGPGIPHAGNPLTASCAASFV